MSITSVLGRGWGSPTDWSRINPGNNGKDRLDQEKDASGTPDRPKDYADRKRKADGNSKLSRVMLRWSTLERGRTVGEAGQS
ncbi:hypothetical protein Tco_0079185 [Tanacetum coccineum]